MDVSNEFNFIANSLPNSDISLFFHPEDNDVFNRFDEQTSIMAHIMYAAGIFSSVSQARKNGWDKPIPKGFSDIRVGKLKKRITILNIW